MDMVKVLAFLRFLPEFAGAVGRARYETRHAPLAQNLFPMISAYRRNYRIEPASSDGTSLPFDVITEMCFADRDAYEAFQLALKGEAGKIIAADSTEFMDRSASLSWIVEEETSPSA